MARSFSAATAEQVIAVVEAVVVNGEATSVNFVAKFSDLTKDQAEAALELATDIKLLSRGKGKFSVSSPLCRFVATPNQMQKAAILRVVLESYEPFVIFRERLVATTLAATAAQQIKAVLGLDAHREKIKDTLLSLGTYSHALITEGGGRYRPQDNREENTLQILAEGCEELAAAEARIREQLGPDAQPLLSRDDVIVPLAEALLRARNRDARGAVVTGGNATESFLEVLANRLGVDVEGANGINAKLDRLSQANRLPRKLLYVGKYLGHVRNAADHGVDAGAGGAWTIRNSTGLEYVFVACSFIASVTAYENNRALEI